MRVLGIETSATLGGFALVEDGRLVAEMMSDITGQHVERGVPMIDEILSRAGVTVGELDCVAVSLGPGSFTGLRVGLAIAKGICFGAGIDMVGVPTLDCIAESLACWEGVIVPVRDARRGEIYLSVYRARQCKITRIRDYLAMAPADVIAEVKSLEGEPRVLLAGDALVPYGETLASGLGSRATFAPEIMWAARPAIVALVGSSLLREGKTSDLDTIEPMYVRPSEAERKMAGRPRDGENRDTKDD